MSITVVLNKLSEDEYGFSKSPDTRLPLVITRDSVAVQQLAYGSGGGDGARLLLEAGEESGGGAADREFSVGREQKRKWGVGDRIEDFGKVTGDELIG
jgi:hypothetical protein